MEPPLEGRLVRRVTNEWGEIADNYSEIRTRVVLDGANLIDIHIDSVGLRYDASMNGVRVARSEKKGVSLNRRSTTIHLSARIDRDRLLDWWPTHVNNGESTHLVIRPHVTVDLPSVDLSAIDFAGVLPRRAGFDAVSVETSNYTNDFTTKIIDSIKTDSSMPLKAFGKTVFRLSEVDASWGEADEGVTPINISVALKNPNPVAVGFDDLGYTVSMNGVEVGEGDVGDFVLPARGATTVESTAVLQNERIADWWQTHLRRGENTQTKISFDGKVRALGFSRPVGGRSYTDGFETDLFGGGLPS